MAEQQLRNIDWLGVNRYSFYSARGDVLSESNEATVYLRKDLPFVIKVLTNPKNQTTQLQMASDLNGLVPDTVLAEGVEIKVDNRRVALASCIVQERVTQLDFVTPGKAKPSDVPQLDTLIKEKVELDNLISRKGFFVPDPKFLNYGVDSLGRVRLLDLGGIVNNPFYDEGYIQRLLIRGAGHYFNYFGIQIMFNKHMPVPTREGLWLATKYEEYTGLEFDTSISAQTFVNTGPYLYNLARLFGSKFLKISLDELIRQGMVAVPQNRLIDTALAAQSHNWIVRPNGEISLSL